jgi:hypothetical protein
LLDTAVAATVAWLAIPRLRHRKFGAADQWPGLGLGLGIGGHDAKIAQLLKIPIFRSSQEVDKGG